MNKEEEVYAAFALYLLGMEVANADRDIDKREFSAIFATAERASEVCHSGFVRRVTGLLAGQINQKSRSRPLAKLIETNNSTHEDIFRRVGRFLETLKQEDYARYLLTAMVMVKQVSVASDDQTLGSRSNGRYGAAGLYCGILSTWVNMSSSDVLAWIEKNEYGTEDISLT